MLKSSLATAPEKVKSLTYKLEMRSIVMVKHAVMLDAVQAGAACYTVNMGETCSVRKKEAKERHRVFLLIGAKTKNCQVSQNSIRVGKFIL